MRFQDAAPDARALVYAGSLAEPLVARLAALRADATYEERVLARAVMNGMTTEDESWRAMFPTVFAAPDTQRADAILAASLEVADRGEQVRSQYRGAIVESLTAILLARRLGPAGPASAVRRERRILFDGVRAEIHPYDVTLEIPGRAVAVDCKWGARGISADVLHQLDDAAAHAADEDEHLEVVLVVFDAERSCEVRLERHSAPRVRTTIIGLESIDSLAQPAARPA